MSVHPVEADYEDGVLSILFDGELTESEEIGIDGFEAVLPTGKVAVFSTDGWTENADGHGTLSFAVSEGDETEAPPVVTYSVTRGMMGLAIDNFRAMLAACDEFQDFVNESTAAGAIDHIYRDALPLPEENDTYDEDELAETHRPFALLWVDDQGGGFARGRISGAPNPGFDESGRLHLLLEQQVPDAVMDDPGECERLWRNRFGQIIDELCALSHQAGYLAMERIEIEAGPGRVTKGERCGSGDHQFVQIAVSYEG